MNQRLWFKGIQCVEFSTQVVNYYYFINELIIIIKIFNKIDFTITHI